LIADHAFARAAPGFTDKTFAADLYKNFESQACFEANSLRKGCLNFVVNHFAGPVVYDLNGFVKRNKNQTPKGISDLLMSSSISFVRDLGYLLNDKKR